MVIGFGSSYNFRAQKSPCLYPFYTKTGDGRISERDLDSYLSKAKNPSDLKSKEAGFYGAQEIAAVKHLKEAWHREPLNSLVDKGFLGTPGTIQISKLKDYVETEQKRKE